MLFVDVVQFAFDLVTSLFLLVVFFRRELFTELEKYGQLNDI